MTQLSDQIRARLLEGLEAKAERLREVERLLAEPAVAADGARMAELAREHGALSKLVEKLEGIRQARRVQQEAQETLQSHPEDAELRQLAQDELAEAREEEDRLMHEVVDLLATEDEDGERNVILEIRAGTGGEEAALFAADLLRMYTRYAEKRGWRVEQMHISPTDLGGVREAICAISGRGSWRTLRYESGGHRVQRVPETESQGRIHTSLATVAVLPEAGELDVQIDPEDIEMSFMRSSGPGGQHVNKTSSCVRLVHKPTGITVRCQDEKSQQANRRKAMKILRARLYEKQLREQRRERDALRRSQVGTGDRNERIRTYNFPQDRITDHRIGLDLFGIENFLLGDCDRMFEALAEHDRQQRIKDIAAEGARPSTES